MLLAFITWVWKNIHFENNNNEKWGLVTQTSRVDSQNRLLLEQVAHLVVEETLHWCRYFYNDRGNYIYIYLQWPVLYKDIKVQTESATYLELNSSMTVSIENCMQSHYGRKM